jgi:hypothetical protein
MDAWYFVRYNAVLLHRSTVVWVLYVGISTVIFLLHLARLQSASPPTVSVSTLRMALGQVDDGSGATAADTVTLTPSSAAKNDPSIPSTLLTYLGNYKDVNVGVGAGELLVGDGGGFRGGGGGDGNNSDDDTSEKYSAELIRSLLAGFGNDAYILGACTKTQTMRIALKPHASVEDQLEATWHALRAGQILAATAAAAATDADATDAGHSLGFSSASSLDAVVRAVLGSKKAAQNEWCGVETALRANGFETKWALLAAGPLRVDCSDELECAGMASTKHYPPKKHYLPTIVTRRGDDRPRAGINRSVRRRHPASPTATLIELTPIAATGGYHRRPIHLDGIRGSSHSAVATVAVISGSGGGVVAAAKDAFFGSVLPRGFPEAVAPEYIEYQVWDTLQVLCADLRGAVTTQATLIAIGVGSTTANPSNVVFDDMVISLVGAGVTLFIGSVCTSSKSAPYMKLWRVLDTVLSFISACLDMVSGMAPRRRLVLRCCGVTLRSIAGPLGGGARSSLVLHLANYSINPSFLADVASKERNQDRILGLALMTVRFALLVWIGLNFRRAWLVVVLLSALHLVFNALAVRVLLVDSKMLAGGETSKRA